MAFRVQASVGNLLAKLIPRAQIVPAVRGEDMSDDPAVVSLSCSNTMPWNGLASVPDLSKSLDAFPHHLLTGVYHLLARGAVWVAGISSWMKEAANSFKLPDMPGD